MKKQIIIALAIITMFAISCGQSTNNNSVPTSTSDTTVYEVVDSLAMAIDSLAK